MWREQTVICFLKVSVQPFCLADTKIRQSSDLIHSSIFAILDPNKHCSQGGLIFSGNSRSTTTVLSLLLVLLL